MVMSEKAFTPGPWIVMHEESDKSYVRIRGTQLGERYKIANVLTPEYEGARELESDETRANANLISASPDLLEALVVVFEMTIPKELKDIFGADWYAKARAAIAKARGEA